MAFGLLGRTLGHSFSKTIHAALGLTDYTYYEKSLMKSLIFSR